MYIYIYIDIEKYVYILKVPLSSKNFHDFLILQTKKRESRGYIPKWTPSSCVDVATT